jgi:hypothetical protein
MSVKKMNLTENAIHSRTYLCLSVLTVNVRDDFNLRSMTNDRQMSFTSNSLALNTKINMDITKGYAQKTQMQLFKTASLQPNRKMSTQA